MFVIIVYVKEIISANISLYQTFSTFKNVY